VKVASQEEGNYRYGSGQAPDKGLKAEVGEFLRQFSGPKSSFYLQAKEVSGSTSYNLSQLASILDSYISYVNAGLQADVSPERRAQLDVVSDFLEQAQQLLADKRTHPAIPAFLIGATLEEFLRTWIETAELSLGNRKPGLQNYSAVLRDADLIDKQDAKDITAWAGLRNHAAHGEWEEVSDKRRVSLMLEGVNLFMRKYGA
jgi:hypothetical protein